MYSTWNKRSLEPSKRQAYTLWSCRRKPRISSIFARQRDHARSQYDSTNLKAIDRKTSVDIVLFFCSTNRKYSTKIAVTWQQIHLFCSQISTSLNMWQPKGESATCFFFLLKAIMDNGKRTHTFPLHLPSRFQISAADRPWHVNPGRSPPSRSHSTSWTCRTQSAGQCGVTQRQHQPEDDDEVEEDQEEKHSTTKEECTFFCPNNVK